MRPFAKTFYQEVVLKHSSDECLQWPFATNGLGYGVLGNKLVHRLVCEHFYGPPDGKREAAHSCGNRGCCARGHVSWKTHSENMADMKLHGTVNIGSRNGAAVLTDAKVLAIRELSGRQTQRWIASAFGVNQATVSDIIRRETWGHV